ncbi:MAG: TolC family protein [Oscillibacter sp.]|jgi:outer membrane protein TolC|nr:TolC family protein [uncultured Oscillibacter sp.]MCI8971401.1 TolC family protein [Oscillibacter sp.]MCI9579571.1 TolC family protein [Oscillibacter sp.]
MKKQWIALLLALTLALPLCAIPALARTDQEEEPAEAAGEEALPEEDAGAAGEAAAQAPDALPPAAGDGGNPIVVRPDGTPETTAGDSTMDDELVFTGEDDFRYLAFEDLREKVLEGSLTARMLQESIASIDAMDYSDMYQSLNAQMSSLEAAQKMYAQIPVSTPMEGAMQGFVISNLASSYASLSANVSDLASGKLQKDSAAARRQLKNAQDLTVVGAESLYFAILELEQTKETLRRNLTALDRQLEEMELRYELGQISALTLEQVRNGRASLQSSLSTLEMNLRRCKLQMQSMVGASLNGSLVLGPLPALSQGLVDSMDYKPDLDEAKTRSYDLFAAKKKLDEAGDAYDDTRAGFAQDTYNVRSARHTYEAALYEYKMSVQSFEMNFRNAFDSVKDYQQVLRSAQTSLAFQESTYASQELKYRQGTISHNALLDAEDQLTEAKEAVETARRNLFTAYRTYYWAVNYGVVSSGQAGT